MASILKLRVPAQGVDGLFPGNAFDDPPQGESPEKCEISCVNPISHFGDSDVWSYTLTNKLPRGSLYDEGYKKIGCKCCPPAPKDTISSIAVDEEKAVKESLKSLGYL
jgi:3'-phosphoadenosine 5'-phosphosulfate sulfotransferase (PAPS reductase)/FAD synthetase